MVFSYGDRLSLLVQESYYPGPDIVTSAAYMENGAVTANDSEAWDICWPVIAAFSVRANNPFNRYCMICHVAVPAGNFCSNFVSEAVGWTCQHQEKGFLCAACDEDFLLRVSLQKQKCWEKGCKGDVEVKMAVVEARMNGSDAFTRYRDMVEMECIVCGDRKARGHRPITKQCKHKKSTCSGCLSDMIGGAVARGGWDKLRCPDLQCKKELEFEDVRAAASPDAFSRYDDLLSQRMFKRLPNYTQCNRPDGSCKSGQIHEPGDNDPQMVCIACDFISCFSCSAAWHEGKTCLQAHSLLADDPATREFKRKYCKRCPGAGCGLHTKKNGACHEMQCPNTECGVMWCWECKLIMNTSQDYSTRARVQHLAVCSAPVVRGKKSESGYKSINKPVGDGRYRSGWDLDDGFIGTGEEY